MALFGGLWPGALAAQSGMRSSLLPPAASLAAFTALLGTALATADVAPAAADPRPVARHVGKWSAAPQRCPSSMVTDGPLLGNVSPPSAST